MALDDFNRRRNLWFGVTLAAFLAHNFWLYVLLVAAMVAIYGSRDRNPVALYVVLLFSVPPFSVPIPGFGLINYVFELDHIRLLNLTLLLAALVRSRQETGGDPSAVRSAGAAGGLLIAYVGLLVALTLILSPFTGAMRLTFTLTVDILLPFYVGYRTLRSRAALTDVAAAFVLAGTLLASIALFEFGKRWLLYSSLEDALNVPWAMNTYLLRGDAGALRAMASTGQSIVLGYVLVISLACSIVIAPRIESTTVRWSLFVLLAAGLLASLSRGPWVGAAVMLLTALGIGPGAMSRLLRGGVILIVVCGLLAVSPWGTTMVDYLPFIGTVDSGTVDYRSRLFEVSINVLAGSPWFGAWDYMLRPAMEEMRQGEGIIDMVNTYLAVAMSTGLVGLSLFSGVFIVVAWSTFKAWRAASPDPEWNLVGRCLLGALAGAAVTIATVSSIGVVPTVYWLLAGVMLAYARMPAHTKPNALPRAQSRSARGVMGARVRPQSY